MALHQSHRYALVNQLRHGRIGHGSAPGKFSDPGSSKIKVACQVHMGSACFGMAGFFQNEQDPVFKSAQCVAQNTAGVLRPPAFELIHRVVRHCVRLLVALSHILW